MAPTEYNRPRERQFGTVRAASSITLLAGIWLFVSPWVYGAYIFPSAWNSWIMGAAIGIMAAVRVSDPARRTWLSWANCLLGMWTFFSPWIFGYTMYTGRFVNSLCVGVLVVVTAITSATATSRQVPQLPGRT